MTALHLSASIPASSSLILLCRKDSSLQPHLSKSEESAARKAFAQDRKSISFRQENRLVFILLHENGHTPSSLENIRKAGSVILTQINEEHISHIAVTDCNDQPSLLLALVEGLALSNYQFLRHKKNPEKELNSLRKITVVSKSIDLSEVKQLEIVNESVCIARDLVNEPFSHLNSVQLAKAFQQLGREAGFKVDVFSKAKITALKMGGLLSVNRGSKIPPTFTIMEWKPAKAKNKKPIVLVGKGVVFDTGGYNIKVGTGMETMKCDMAGAAAVGATMYAIAKAKLPVHVIGLVPATDNCINSEAFVAGDVITMYNGLTVEVLNTDAEGRMILADALAWSAQYKPELVIDLATLTGAAAVAIGPYGIVAMGTASEETKSSLEQSGLRVHERLAEFPFWDEYDDLIKSDVAEIKNIGGPAAGAITAGKFLAHFVKTPWMHFDIAGPSFLTAKDSYRPKGGTGVGVRLLFDFLNHYPSP